MTTAPLGDWYDVGEFEIESAGGPDASIIVPIRLARDAGAGFQVIVGDDESGVERLASPIELVSYFANYGAPHLIDLHGALAGIEGFEEVCGLVEQRLSARGASR